ncbi:MAG: response regulator transcription factor [Symploca sp. SIO2C1]|nr:response regulator transcription factor [Symploca sp. SIO2C1]
MIQNLTKPGKLKIVVVDDHELTLDGAFNALQQQYPDAQILRAKTAQSTINQVTTLQPDLVIMDLSIPETAGEPAHIDTGIQALRTLIKKYTQLNLVVLSSYTKALVRIRHDLEAHEGGLTVANKDLSSKEMLKRVDWALQGLVDWRVIRGEKAGLELKPEWLELLRLAFEEGLEDKAIAERMRVAIRTVRHYWSKVQDVLKVYPEDGKNLRISTEMRARELWLID